MSVLALLGGIYFIIAGIIGKGKAFTSKMGTPLVGKEFKAVRYTYIAVGIALLLVAAVSAVQLFE
ncbi:MAG: hypothetical protein LUI05_07795 [Oscillospiraceae bacterium]|nr:hypothetical protein [Oscillospiraceae bacterium]